jgi:hypothetical protein
LENNCDRVDPDWEVVHDPVRLFVVAREQHDARGVAAQVEIDNIFKR